MPRDRAGQRTILRSTPHAANNDKGINVEQYSHRDSILEALGVVSGQWVTAALMTLSERPMQYNELLTEINTFEEQHGWLLHSRPLSQKVLTQTLQRMRRDGLVLRTAIDANRVGGPVRYHLTPMGRALLRALRPLGAWHQHYRTQLHEARAHHPRLTDR